MLHRGKHLRLIKRSRRLGHTLPKQRRIQINRSRRLQTALSRLSRRPNGPQQPHRPRKRQIPGGCNRRHQFNRQPPAQRSRPLPRKLDQPRTLTGAAVTKTSRSISASASDSGRIDTIETRARRLRYKTPSPLIRATSRSDRSPRTNRPRQRKLSPGRPKRLNRLQQRPTTPTPARRSANTTVTGRAATRETMTADTMKIAQDHSRFERCQVKMRRKHFLRYHAGGHFSAIVTTIEKFQVLVSPARTARPTTLAGFGEPT